MSTSEQPTLAAPSDVVVATAVATRYSLSRNDRDSAVLTVSDQGAVVYVSPRGRALFGRSPGTAVHDSVLSRVRDPQDSEALRETLWRVATGETDRATVTVTVAADDGPVAVDVRVEDLRADDTVRGVVAVARVRPAPETSDTDVLDLTD